MGMISTVRKGGFMMILADQQLREGDDIPFFGHPARTAIAHLKSRQKQVCRFILPGQRAARAVISP